MGTGSFIFTAKSAKIDPSENITTDYTQKHGSITNPINRIE
jgi:hypothetical protein